VRQSADEMFERRVEALSATLREQMELYEAEQRTLQVVLPVCTYTTGSSSRFHISHSHYSIDYSQP